MRTPPHSIFFLSFLLLAPGVQAAALLVEPDDDARGRVDADRARVGAVVSVSGDEAAAAPEGSGRGLDAKVFTPLAAEAATPARRIQAADGAVRADAGDDNVSTRHTRWLGLRIEVTAVSEAAPVAVRVEADGADVMARRTFGYAHHAPSVHEAAPRLAHPVAPRLADAPPATPALPAPDASGADPAPPREDAGPRAASTARPERADATPASEDAAPLVRAAAFAAGLALLALLPWALYHRIIGADASRAPTRSRILALLHERPGLGATDTARALALDPTTARYHLRRLAREGLAVEHGPAARPRYFAAGSVAVHERARHCATDARRRVLDAVAASPGLSPTVLARGLALARPTVSWHVGRLARDGLVVVERAGREVRVRPAQG